MTAEERAEKLMDQLPLEEVWDESEQDVISTLAAAIRAAEDAATLKERERLAAILMKEAALYEEGGEPGVLSFLWGWRDSAKRYREMAGRITATPAAAAPAPAPSQTPASSG